MYFVNQIIDPEMTCITTLLAPPRIRKGRLFGVLLAPSGLQHISGSSISQRGWNMKPKPRIFKILILVISRKWR